DGKPIVGTSREEFSTTGKGPTFTKTLTYPTANRDTAAATLTVRQHETDPRKPLPPTSWSYVDARHVRINRADGFDSEALYELVYPATDAVIQGIAFVAVRDFVSFLRYADKDSTGQPNPVHPATPFKAVLGMGVSQSGCLLKDMVYQNFHVDAAGRKIFDGILDVVSGARATSVNMEFSQPGRFSRQHEDHLFPNDQFPFTYATTTDPISGKTDGLQATCSKARTCPLTIHADTDTETWLGHGSLVFTDPTGKPVTVPDNVRIFSLTSIPHNGRDLGDLWESDGKPERGICKQYRNPLEYRYYIRAMFVALDEWVTEGKMPPASRYPNRKDGTLVTVEEAAKLWPAVPDVPFSPVISKLRLTDYSHQPPTVSGPEYPLFVGRINADGNPVGGIETPEVAVPIGTYSGRNIRAAGFAENDLCGLNGSYIPFAVTREERLATKDARLSLEERYKNPADFVAKRKAATDKLVRERLLLAEDAPLFSAVTLPKW
ncbi:MAG: alpha/beta hydrolase domain-containing protein, partial [Acidobacteriota bacterium]